MTCRICVSILPRNVSEALELVGKAEEANADFVEVRLDCLDTDCDLAIVAADRKTPLIATDKSERTEAEHRAILLNAAKSGFQYVDVDLSVKKSKNLTGEIKVSGANCIVSFHDFNSSLGFPELHAVLKKEISEGADICKIVTTAKRPEDNLTLLQFVAEASAKTKIVCFAMGEQGKMSRLLSPVFGAYFTFASLEGGSETAPGQMTLREMKAAYELLGIK